MKLFIVVDKQEGVSWICSDIESVFESTGRGGFTIFPKIEGIEGTFSDDEIVWYEHGNLKDLKSKIDYYLEHDDEREAIRIAGNKRTKSSHTYTQRWKEILERLEMK